MTNTNTIKKLERKILNKKNEIEALELEIDRLKEEDKVEDLQYIIDPKLKYECVRHLLSIADDLYISIGSVNYPDTTKSKCIITVTANTPEEQTLIKLVVEDDKRFTTFFKEEENFKSICQINYEHLEGFNRKAS